METNFISVWIFSAIPHLAVSNSTPPPSSSSPAPVKIKAEPISPPRDQLLSQHQQQSLGGSSLMGLNNHSSAGSLGSNLNHSHMMNSRPSSTGHSPTPGKRKKENVNKWRNSNYKFHYQDQWIQRLLIWGSIRLDYPTSFPTMTLPMLRTQNDQEYQR